MIPLSCEIINVVVYGFSYISYILSIFSSRSEVNKFVVLRELSQSMVNKDGGQ